jgi:hypothetical protein
VSVWISVSLSIIALLLVPILRLMWNAGRAQQKIEDTQDTLIKAVQKLVEDKDKVHAEMIMQMREDRNATNIRLRWLEENMWNRGAKR